MTDIWVVSNLQLPGQGAEDAYLEFPGAIGTHLPWVPGSRLELGLYSPHRHRPGRLEGVDVSVRLYWAVMGF